MFNYLFSTCCVVFLVKLLCMNLYVKGEEYICPKNISSSLIWKESIYRLESVQTLFQILHEYQNNTYQINCNLLACRSASLQDKNSITDVYPENHFRHLSLLTSFITSNDGSCYENIFIIAYQCSLPETLLLQETIQRHCDSAILYCYELDWYKTPLSTIGRTLSYIFSESQEFIQETNIIMLALSVMDTLLVLKHLDQFNPLPGSSCVSVLPRMMFENFVRNEYSARLLIENLDVYDDDMSNDDHDDNTNELKKVNLMQEVLDCRVIPVDKGSEIISNELETKQDNTNNNSFHFRVVTIIYSPYVVLVEDLIPTNNNKICKLGIPCRFPVKSSGNETFTTTQWEWRCCYGVYIEIFKEIAKIVDFSYEIYIAEDGKWGGLENGTWNGMIRDVLDNKADIALQALICSSIRFQFVDFTPPLQRTHYVVILRRKIETVPDINWKFAEGIDMSLVYALLISAAICSTCVAVLQNCGFIMKIDNKFPLREVMSYFGGLISQRDLGGKTPVYWSGRVISLSFAIGATMIVNTYTAFLTASNINLSIRVEFEGLSDEKIRHPTSAFTFGAVESTVAESIIKNNPSGYYDGVWDFMRHYSVSSDKEGIDAVHSGKLDGFISNYDDVLPFITTSKHCDSLEVYHEKSDSPVGFIMKRDFILRDEIAKACRYLLEMDTIDNVIEKWIYTPSCEKKEVEIQSFTEKYFFGVLLFMGCIVVFCIILVLSENCYVSLKRK